MVTNEALELERARYEEFKTLWIQGEFAEQRLGQAFYNYFKLHMLQNQALLYGLYESDEDEAQAIIQQIFLFR